MKRKIREICTIFFAALFFLSGCSAFRNQDSTGISAVRGQEAASVYAPAEKNRLTVYTSHQEDIYSPIIKEFEERTGIWVSVKTGGTMELLEAIAAESEKPQCDVIFGGGIESLDSYRNHFSPYQSSLTENLPSEYLQEDGLWTPFSIPPVVLIYNPKLIRTNPPTGWDSLINPAWKGKIAFADPEISGSSYTALATLLQILPGEKAELLQLFFHNLEGRTLSDSGMVVSEVANGSCYIGVTLEENALRGIKKGYDIAMVYPEEGTSAIPDGTAIISGCPHEENARLFLDFTLGNDVQTYLSESCNLRAVQADIPQPDGVTQDFPCFDYDIGWAAGNQEEILASWHSLKTDSEVISSLEIPETAGDSAADKEVAP